MPYVVQPQPVSPLTLRRLPPLSPVLPSAPAMSPLQLETCRDYLQDATLPYHRGTFLSSKVPPLSASRRTLANGPLPTTPSRSRVVLNPQQASPGAISTSLPRLEQSSRKMPPNWFDTVHLRYSPSADDHTIPPPTSIEFPNLRPTGHRRSRRYSSSLSVKFLRGVYCLRRARRRRNISSPMWSPARSVIIYVTGTFCFAIHTMYVAY